MTGHGRTSWIGVPLAADEPARAALFRTFLTQRNFRFEESDSAIAIAVDEATAIATAIRPWAEPDMPDDPRTFDSLTLTLMSVRDTVLSAIEDAGLPIVGPDRAGIGWTDSSLDRGFDDPSVGGIDLR